MGILIVNVVIDSTLLTTTRLKKNCPPEIIRELFHRTSRNVQRTKIQKKIIMSVLSTFTSGQRDWIPVGLVGLGSFFCLQSIGMTLKHAKSTEFEAPTYYLGRKHPRYHAFRGATLAMGALATLNLVAWSSKIERAESGFWRLWLVGPQLRSDILGVGGFQSHCWG